MLCVHIHQFKDENERFSDICLTAVQDKPFRDDFDSNSEDERPLAKGRR